MVRRVILLLILVVVAGSVIWATTTNQKAKASESLSLDSLELGDTFEAQGLTLNLTEEESGNVPVVLLHDFDLAGGVTMGGVASELGEPYRGVRIDLPGFGFSQRLVETGSGHTLASMAERVATLIQDRYGNDVIIVGVGFGGEVAAELAVSSPGLVSGLVLIDVDFWQGSDWVDIAQRLPLVGPAVTYSFLGGGQFGVDRWAPFCDLGGWCPTDDQVAVRGVATSIRGSTDSIQAFLRTPPASLVPSDLDSIVAPVVYVWSNMGVVPFTSVELIQTELPNMDLVEVDAWQTHLEMPEVVVAAVESLNP